MGVKSQEPLEQLNERKQCRILIVLRTPTFPTGMRLLDDMLLEHLYQTALAYAGFATE